jgi:hypothetical protein
MSYRPKRHSSYDPNYRKRTGNYQFTMRKTKKKEFFGQPIIKDTEEIECSHVPSLIDEITEKSIAGNVNYGALCVGGSLTDKKRSTTKFNTQNKDTKKQNKRKTKLVI